MTTMRQPTLETLGLGNVLTIFRQGRLPVSAESAVDEVFGPAGSRGALVISGSDGIVGAGKMMQLGSRLVPFGVTMVGLDFAGAPDSMQRQYRALGAAFGKEKADAISAGVVRLNYDGRTLPSRLREFHPRFLLEAIPEILDVKKAHYAVFRETFPGIEIRSVTSGFPASELGVGIAHPAFPHEINKVWEIVEEKPSSITRLLWALGLQPMPVGDHWSFVLDVLFCGLTLAALRYQGASNMPVWKIDKYIRRLLGPNPLRAHDAIGAKGATFLTWSCLHHLSQKYGKLFAPCSTLEYRKESGQDWYPPNHFRPLVNWSMTAEEEEEFSSWILGSMIQMTSLLLHERRAHLSFINAIGEVCAQFRKGTLAVIRKLGQQAAVRRVEAYHKLYPPAAEGCWYPEALEQIHSPEGQQLYVNAEHDGKVGVISISRESYNSDVDAELNRAIDWLKAARVERVIVCGDFHLSTQMVGADTSEFFPALAEPEAGIAIASSWSKTARRLYGEFRVSVGFINGKRCLGGMLELMTHCSHLVAQRDAMLGMPEVTLPVVPGMEGCHWPFRKAGTAERQKLLRLLLTGESVRAGDAVGWLVDFAGTTDDCLKQAWQLASAASPSIPPRRMVETGLDVGIEGDLPPASGPAMEEARKAILDCVRQSCRVPLAEALAVQAKYSGDFMAGKRCREGVIGSEAAKIQSV
jgi:enoyl-CoA hydratase/carnithine racemase